MEYRLKSGEDTKTAQVEIEENNRFKVELDQRSFEVDYFPVSDHHLHLTVNGEKLNVYTLETEKGKIISINGVHYQLKDADSLKFSTQTEKSAGASDKITPITPSVVVSVLVQEEEIVEKGQGIIVLSAMKMETTLKAPYHGKVVKMNAVEGDKVAPGQILAKIDPLDE